MIADASLLAWRTAQVDADYALSDLADEISFAGRPDLVIRCRAVQAAFERARVARNAYDDAR